MGRFFVMDVIKTQIKVRDLVKGYHDDPETNQVVGYDGKLSIRPAFQRQFVYKDNQRDEVIRTINKGFPLSIFYWAKTPDGWEILDGQQRTISICQYVNGDFSLDYRYFHNLTEEEKNKILDYELDVYLCDGTDAEKMEWFKVINIAGEKLTDQELRNAVYAGSWLSEAKKKFSARNCAAERIAKDYLSGRQSNGLRSEMASASKNIWRSISMILMRMKCGSISAKSSNGSNPCSRIIGRK